VLVAYLVLVLTASGQAYENQALVGAREESRELRAESLSGLDELTALSFALAIVVVVAVALLRRKPLLAAAAAGIMVGSVAVTEALQRLLVRPELVEAPVYWLSNSFPSGHAAVAVAVGISAVLVAPYVLRALVTLGAAAYAMSVELAVVTAGWHRLSDVVGAAALVLAVACVALYLLARVGHIRLFLQPRRIGFTAVALVLGGATLIFSGVGLMGWLELLPITAEPSLPSPPPLELRLAFTTTLVLGAAAIGLAFLSFLWLVRPYAIDEPVEPPARG
jgi:hypothetical protein